MFGLYRLGMCRVYVPRNRLSKAMFIAATVCVGTADFDCTKQHNASGSLPNTPEQTYKVQGAKTPCSNNHKKTQADMLKHLKTRNQIKKEPVILKGFCRQYAPTQPRYWQLVFSSIHSYANNRSPTILALTKYRR